MPTPFQAKSRFQKKTAADRFRKNQAKIMKKAANGEPVKLATPQELDRSDWPVLTILGAREWRPLSKTSNIPTNILAASPQLRDIILRMFADYLARLLRQRVIRAIRSQQFKMRFQPLAASTVKAKHGNRRFWIDTGFTIRAISVWGQRSNYFIGFRASQRHPKSGTSVLLIAKALEFGSPTRNIPPRPVFTSEASAISRDISRIFVNWIRTNAARLDALQRQIDGPRENKQPEQEQPEAPEQTNQPQTEEPTPPEETQPDDDNEQT